VVRGTYWRFFLRSGNPVSRQRRPQSAETRFEWELLRRKPKHLVLAGPFGRQIGEAELQSFEAVRDEWSAMEAVVHLELLLEAGGLLIEESTAYASRSGHDQSRAA
jgi:hypothetical protein